METLFWTSIAIIIYTYIGYGVVLYIIMRLRRIITTDQEKRAFTPSLTIIVTAYNEINCIEEKIHNTLSLAYPPELLQIVFITDGSDDGTVEAIATHAQIKLMHTPKRAGKMAAMNRAMKEVTTDVVVFTDANTILNTDALLCIGNCYQDEKTGAVSGEKRVDSSGIHDATAGEGFYWKYESFLKYCESEIYSVAGAAGELFSVRTVLYEQLASDTILDDLVLSIKILLKGYHVKYEPHAYATEKTSPSLAEEGKRKLRIAAGDIQALTRLPFFSLLFSKPLLWFEYLSHRVLRWVIAPYLLIAAFILNMLLIKSAGYPLYILLYAQLFFYAVAAAGWLLRRQNIHGRLFFVPYYFCLMNYSIIAGTLRYIFKGQPVNWEKAVRRK